MLLVRRGAGCEPSRGDVSGLHPALAEARLAWGQLGRDLSSGSFLEIALHQLIGAGEDAGKGRRFEVEAARALLPSAGFNRTANYFVMFAGRCTSPRK